MLGPPKSRDLDDPIRVSLESLVPPDHCSRHLERTLDLTFMRDVVRGTYAGIGRPSIDPMVFFTLQLILFFEGLRSERQLMRVVADRLSLRWDSRIRPERSASRSLESDADPGTVRRGDLPPLFRRGRRAVQRGRIGVGTGTGPSTRPMLRRMHPSTRSNLGLPSRRISLSSSRNAARARETAMTLARALDRRICQSR